MPCYTRAAAAVISIAVVTVMAWTHASAAVPAGLIILIACIATLAVLGWTSLIIRRNRAEAGACTGCRLACQQPAVRPEQAGLPLPWPQRAGASSQLAEKTRV